MEGLARGSRRRVARCIGMALFAAAVGMWTLAPPVCAVGADEVPVLAAGEAVRGAAVVDGVAIVDGRTVLNINQTSDRAVINWSSFNVGKNATVNFNHTKDGAQNTAGMTLNRVVGGEMSKIYGQINAIGSVVLVNPAGVLFAEGSEVNVAGIVASTAEVDVDKFYEAGELVFAQAEGSPNANVTVAGRLSAAINGDYLAPGSVYAQTLAATSLNIGERQVVTHLSAAGNKIMLVADGDVSVDASGELVATTVTNVAASDGAAESAVGAIVLRADQNADDINAVGSAAQVILHNDDPEQIQGLNVAAYYNGAIVTGVKATLVSGIATGSAVNKFTKKNYKGAASYAETLRGKVAPNVTKYENSAGEVNYSESSAVSTQRYATLINDIYQLQCIENKTYGNLAGDYALGCDIEARDTASWASGFNPIGTVATPFTGSFSGEAGTGSYSIYDLTINRPGESYVGLFAQASGATIKDVTLVDPVINGKAQVGGIAGGVADTLLANVTMRKRVAALDGASTTTNEANIAGLQYVGGIAGYMDSSELVNAENGGLVTGSIYVGELAGYLAGSASSSGVVSISASRNRGYYSASENVAQGYGLVYGRTISGIGGLVGGATAASGSHRLVDSYSNGMVTAETIDSVRGQAGVGGLVGYIEKNMTIERAYNSNLPEQGATPIASDTARSVYGQVTSAGDNVGGIVGQAGRGTVLTQVYNAGNITGASNVGGLVGKLSGSTTDSYSADSSTLRADAENPSETVLAYRDATVTGTGRAGGVVGYMGSSKASIENTYAAGAVTGETAGGVVGAAYSGATASGENFYIATDDIDEDTLPAIGSGSLDNTTSYTLAEVESLVLGDAWVIYPGSTLPVLKSLTLEQSVTPTEPEPENPTEPEQPSTPETPSTEPEKPTDPEKPSPSEQEKPTEPEQPTEPETPQEPSTPPTEEEKPTEPAQPTEPVLPAEPTAPSEGEQTPTEPKESAKTEQTPTEPVAPEPAAPLEPAQRVIPRGYQTSRDSAVATHTSAVRPQLPAAPPAAGYVVNTLVAGDGDDELELAD